jgi:AcrR family transcriptional regulator
VPGPAPTRTREEIAAAAIALADAEGIAAVTMRRVAAEVNLATMSLYNYLPRKDDLYDLMLDAAVGELDLDTKPSGDWRADLHAFARQLRQFMHRHPWYPTLAPARTTQATFGPNILRYCEYLLRVLAPAGMNPGTALEAVVTFTFIVATHVNGELTITDRDLGARLADLREALSTGQFPLFATAIAAADPTEDNETRFRRTMTRLFDGLTSG